MRKTVLGFFAFVFLALLVLCGNRNWMEAFSEFRFSHTLLEPDQRKHGDLYGMCFIQRYKEESRLPVLKTFKPVKRNINLYLLQDSYLQDPLQKENFEGVDSLIQYDYRNDPLSVTLQKGKKNILLIESAERYARNRFQNPNFFLNQFRIADSSVAAKTGETGLEEPVKKHLPGFWESLRAVLVNPNANTNLEFSVFDYSIFSPIRGLKASINYSLFDRLDNRIVISRNSDFLLLKETVDSVQTTGIYTRLWKGEADSMAAHMQVIRNTFRRKGYLDVYFSIVPNTVTLNDSSHFASCKYNGLIYQLRDKLNALGVPYIDAWEAFKVNPAALYKHGDSHWNVKGKQKWLDLVNVRLGQLQ